MKSERFTEFDIVKGLVRGYFEEKKSNGKGRTWTDKQKSFEKLILRYCDNIEKSLKVLEIIKNKKVNILVLDGCDNLEQYNNSIDLFEIPKNNREKYHLTQEEYDLLKEVLL